MQRRREMRLQNLMFLQTACMVIAAADTSLSTGRQELEKAYTKYFWEIDCQVNGDSMKPALEKQHEALQKMVDDMTEIDERNFKLLSQLVDSTVKTNNDVRNYLNSIP